ncbi:MAG: hypothetical protein ACPG7F_04865 [Aggregatilineales bacterium]
MNYEPNTNHWQKGAIVIHDADAKEPRMLMQVIGYTRGGLCKTQYLFREHRRTVWKNRIAVLHCPEQWIHGASEWQNQYQSNLKEYQANFINVRLWNIRFGDGQTVMTTSADGGFMTTTNGKAFYRHGEAWLYLNRTAAGKAGCWWALEHVQPIKKVAEIIVPRQT